MNYKNLSWASGIFEGEGCFYLHKRGNNRVRAYAVVNMTDEDTIRDFHKAVNLGSVWGPYGDYRKIKSGAIRKQQWRWYATGKTAEEFAKVMYPRLNQRRREQINKVLNEINLYKNAI